VETHLGKNVGKSRPSSPALLCVCVCVCVFRHLILALSSQADIQGFFCDRVINDDVDEDDIMIANKIHLIKL